MKHVKPSVKGMSNMGYLGHFAQDKHIQRGHNSDGTVDPKDLVDALDMASGDPAQAAKALTRIQRDEDLNADKKKMQSRNGDDK